MAINDGEYKSVVGIKDLYIAPVVTDTSATYSATPLEKLAPAAEISVEPTQSQDTQYADDQPYDVSYSEGESKISLTVTNIPLQTLAKITGRVFDATNGLMYDNGGTPPYFALLFRSMKSNGKYRYYCYYKGSFSMPKDAAKTKAEKAEPQPMQLEYTAIKTVHKWDLDATHEDSLKRIIGDEDATGFDGSDWFTTVPVPLYVAP